VRFSRLSLQTVILAPIFVIILAAGFALYLLVLRTISDFADGSIESNLASLMANAITIVDSEVDRQNREGLASNPGATLEFQLNARQRLEDFARDQSVGVMTVADGTRDFTAGLLDADWEEILHRRAIHSSNPIKLASGNIYYLREEFFSPWRWSIIVAKDARNFDAVITMVRAIYGGTALGVLLVAGLLAYWLRRLLVRPVYAIAHDLSDGQAPNYEGIKELQYLATSISHMMADQKAKNLHLETTLNSMSDGIAVFDRDMELVFWNSRFAAYYRYPPEILRRGTGFDKMIRYNIDRGDYGPVDAEPLLEEMVLRARTITPPRFEIDRADGSIVEVKRARMPDGGFVTTYTDITDRKQRDRFAAASEAKSQFLQNMSHDLRKPIASIIEDAGALDQGQQEPRRELRDIRANADHLLTMIEDILDMSRIEAGQIEPRPSHCFVASIVAQVSRIVQPRALSKRLALSHTADEALAAETDGRLLSRILLNLASNAVEYTEKGEVRLSARRDGEHIEFEVADTGPGIAAHKLDLIFEKFHRLQPTAGLSRPGHGLGLGLAISRELTRLLHGTLTVTSRLGKGSTFSLRVPISFIEERRNDGTHSIGG